MQKNLIMKLYRQKIWNQKYSEKLFVAPQQGIAPQGMNTINKYTPNLDVVKERMLSGFTPSYAGHYNHSIGEDINNVRKDLRKAYGEEFGYHGCGYKNEMPITPTSKLVRTGKDAQVMENGFRYVRPTSKEIITNVDSIFYPEHAGKRILRIDAVDSSAPKSVRLENYSQFLGTDAGEIRTSDVKILGEDALVSVPRDSGFDRYHDSGGNKIQHTSSEKKLRKFLKKNHRLVNGMDRPTLEFMYGKKNPNIDSIIKNARRIL